MELSLLRDKVKKNRVVFLAVLFGVYMFEYMVTLTFIDQGNIGISTPSWQLALHYIDYLQVVFGFVSFALFRRGFKTEKARIRLLVIPNLVYFVSVILLYFLRSPLPYSALAMLAAFSLGVLGGMVYFCISMALSHTPYMGRVMAAGACGAVLLQYLLQEYLDKWLREYPEAAIDYVHGAAALEELSLKEGNCGMALKAMDKNALFPAIVAGGVLPRKTFSLGEAEEKRYYMECRKIK